MMSCPLPRQQHLSDLRRLVADRERQRTGDDLEEVVGVRESPKRRLSILEAPSAPLHGLRQGEHEELKKQAQRVLWTRCRAGGDRTRGAAQGPPLERPARSVS